MGKKDSTKVGTLSYALHFVQSKRMGKNPPIQPVFFAETDIQLNAPMKHESTVLDFNFSPDGQTIISSTENNVCRLWNVNTGEEITSPYIPANWIDTIINN